MAIMPYVKSLLYGETPHWDLNPDPSCPESKCTPRALRCFICILTWEWKKVKLIFIVIRGVFKAINLQL